MIESFDDQPTHTMSPTHPSPAPHTWTFFRAGGFDQVRLESGGDLLALDQLDQKLWVALACPTTGIEFDARTLALIDTDGDGRVRAPELIQAVKWAGGLLKNPDDLIKRSASLPLAAINDATPEGKALLSSARTILASLGNPNAVEISVEDSLDTVKLLAQTAFNGDGIIVAESAGDDATRTLIADIIDCLGSTPDRSGKPGLDQARLDQFFKEAIALDVWARKAEADADLRPLGEATTAAATALQAVRAKVEDYFGRCRLAAFDARALAALNREEKEYLALAAKDMTLSATEVAGFPLAAIAAGQPLPLKTGLNPAWSAALATFQATVVKPLLGEKSALTEAEWTALSAKFAAYEAWMAGKPATSVEKLGLPRLRDLLAGPGQATLTALIAKDKAEEGSVAAMAAVEKLVHYHRDLHLLCINFVNFKDFYDRGDPATFQAGTLYLDQRSCELCLRVGDVARHATMAALAGTYLAYCDCTRQGSGEKMQIVAAFTDGDSDNLMVGRNGIFYDRKGRDWDATITKLVDNPISIRQAFWSPYKKVVRLIEEQVAKRAAAAEAAAGDKLATTATALPAAKAEPKKVDVGTVAALGVAFGALATALAAIAGYATGLLKLPFWQVCLALSGLLLLVSGPSMIIAYLKLRKRNLGPLLDANGWAVNAKARVNVPFGTSLTGVAKLPPGAVAATDDPFAERPSVWPKFAGFIVVICFLYSLLNSQGLVYQWTGGKVGQSTEEIRQEHEAAKAALAAAAKSLTPATATTNAPAAK